MNKDQRAAASIRELLSYLESEYQGTDGMIGESAKVADRAYAVLEELTPASSHLNPAPSPTGL